eukprot:COSAG06_NODE_59640_length_273_cov_1.143678_1_plen_24_part_01
MYARRPRHVLSSARSQPVSRAAVA